MKSKKTVTTLVATILFTSTILLFEVRTTNAQFQYIYYDREAFFIDNSLLGARASGLAYTQVSDPYSLDGIHSNPAAFLFSDNRTTVSTNLYYSSFHNIVAENITAVLHRNPRNLIVAGFTLQHEGPSSSSSRHIEPEIPVQFRQYEGSIHYARKVGSNISAGGSLYGSYGTTDLHEEWAFYTKFGILYAPAPAVSYGLTYTGSFGIEAGNMGSFLTYRYRIPAQEVDSPENGVDENSGSETLKDGRSYTLLSREGMPDRLEIGATLRFPSYTDHPNFKISFANEKIFDHPGMIYRAGFEYFSFTPLILRGGYFYSPIKSGLRTGFGLNLGWMTIDYSFSNKDIGIQGNTHQVGISINFTSAN